MERRRAERSETAPGRRWVAQQPPPSVFGHRTEQARAVGLLCETAWHLTEVPYNSSAPHRAYFDRKYPRCFSVIVFPSFSSTSSMSSQTLRFSLSD